MNKTELEIAQFLGQILGRAAELSLAAEASGATGVLRSLDQLGRLAGDAFLSWTGQSILDIPALNLETLEPRERIRERV